MTTEQKQEKDEKKINMKLSSTTITGDIEVVAVPQYVPENSNPRQNEFLFSYSMTIKNNGEKPVKLVSRDWMIIDANGTTDSVRGAGVVGQTPTIEGGESFEYQSFCPLKTHWGTMEGNYEFEDIEGKRFTVNIDRFFLADSD